MSNAWVTCLIHMDNIPKGMLIQDDIRDSHGFLIKAPAFLQSSGLQGSRYSPWPHFYYIDYEEIQKYKVTTVKMVLRVCFLAVRGIALRFFSLPGPAIFLGKGSDEKKFKKTVDQYILRWYSITCP